MGLTVQVCGEEVVIFDTRSKKACGQGIAVECVQILPGITQFKLGDLLKVVKSLEESK